MRTIELGLQLYYFEAGVDAFEEAYHAAHGPLPAGQARDTGPEAQLSAPVGGLGPQQA